MDSPLVAGMKPEHEAALRAAGIDSLPRLAAMDPKAVNAKTRIRATMLASYRDAARDRIQEILHEAGVHDMPSLAAASVEDVSARTGLDAATVAEYRDAARAGLWERLRAAGVGSPAALAAHGDLDALARATDVPRGWLERFQAEAKPAEPAPAAVPAPVAGPGPVPTPAPVPATAPVPPPVVPIAPVPSPVPEPTAPVRDPYAGFAPRGIDRIVLDPSVPFARVVLGGAETWSVPVVALARHEDERAAAQKAGVYVVVLKEGAHQGVAVVGGQLHAGLPLYEQFSPPARPDERLERRVRVSALREKKA